MKKFFLLLSAFALSLSVNAQSVHDSQLSPVARSASSTPAIPEVASPKLKFGFFSYNRVLEAMGAYAEANRHLSELRAKYDAEMKRAEQEFNKKYEEYLDGQKDFAPSIAEKRQSELRELMEKNLAFRDNVRKMLAQAKENTFAPIKEGLNAAVRDIAKAKGFAFVLNTDNDAVPYVDLSMGTDINEELKGLLK